MKKTILLCFLLCAAVGLFAKTTVIYHTSDSHGFFFPQKGQGGAAALAAVLKKGPEHYLLLDGGDFAEGTIEVSRSKGLKAVKLMNELGYDAATIGNHEFAYRDQGTEDILAQARFAVLAANMTLAETGQYPKGVLPYKIFDVDGVKIAVVGLANTHPNKSVKKYALTDPMAALEKALKEIEPQNPSAVVVLAHDSVGDDRPGNPHYMGDISRRLNGRVQVVLGGHAHKIFQNEYRNGVLYVESGCNFKNVSKITLETDDKTGRFVGARSELIALDTQKTGLDKTMEKYAESLREPGVDEVVGHTAAEISKKTQKKGYMDSPVDDWVADATCRYAPADVCIHNTGGARVSLPKGEVTRRDIINLYPFDDMIVTTTVSGAFLKELVQQGLLPWNRLTYSGLKVTYKKTKDGKVKKLKIWVRGKRLKEDKQYTLALNAYVAGGSSEGKPFKTLPKSALKTVGKKTIRQVLEEDLKRGVLTPPETGRIRQK